MKTELGKQLAHLHLHNVIGETPKSEKFGFPVATCCGRISLDNRWNDDWQQFYANQRVLPQIEMAADNTAADLWAEFVNGGKMDRMFPDSLQVRPSLLHGDLWSGKVAETAASLTRPPSTDTTSSTWPS